MAKSAGGVSEGAASRPSESEKKFGSGQLYLEPVYGDCPACEGRGWFVGLFGDEIGVRPRCGMCDGTGSVIKYITEKRRL